MFTRKVRSITKAPILKGTRVLVRVDFNVPLTDEGIVADEYRIQEALPTIQYLEKLGARIILISHIEANEGPSLEPVSFTLRKYVAHHFVPKLRGQEVNQIIQDMAPGEVILLENLRLDQGEKRNDIAFAKELASYADIFVNDAFSVSHREHASVIGIPRFLPSYAGFRFMKEIAELSKAFTPHHPFFLAIGGAKFETKLPLVSKFLNTADGVIIGGALANDIFKARGFNIGASVVSDISVSDIANNPKLIVPTDVVVRGGGEGNRTIVPGEVKDNEQIVDVGAQTITDISEKIAGAKLIIWNGPFGLTPDGFDEGTKKLAEAILASGAYTILGGGDSIGALAPIGLLPKFSFVSTAGGAMLQFLSSGTLPGIESLKKFSIF